MSELGSIAGPCSGLRVIEFATMVSGPMAGQILGDLGAEVIKVESITGDPMRILRPFEAGMASIFIQFNRNKKSIALDLKSPEGLRIARELVLSADVLLENFRPDVMERLGLGYNQLKAANPGLIYASLSGFGPTGPYAERPAYDHVIQGLSGIMAYLGEDGDGTPVPIRNFIVDKISSLTMAHGIVAALLARERNGGIGQTVSVSLLDSFASLVMPDAMINHTFQHENAEQIRKVNIYHPIQTSDGYVIGHIQLNAQFIGLCKICDREDLLEHPLFKDAWTRLMNYEAMWKEMEVGARKHTTAELLEKAAANNVPLGPVNDILGFFKDPQVQHNQGFFDIEDPEYGSIRQLGHAVKYGKSKIDLTRRAPKLAEQTDEILEGLGMSEEEIRRAQASGAVK